MPTINRTSPRTPNVSRTHDAQSVSAESTNDVQNESPPSGLDAAAIAGALPQDLGISLDTVSAGMSALDARSGALMRNDLFELNQAYKNTVPLSAILKAAGAQGAPAIKTLIGAFEMKTGVKVPEAMVAAVTAKPELLPNVLQLTPMQMSLGVDALNAAHKAGKIPSTPKREQILGERFDFAKLDQVNYKRPADALEEIAPGILRGHRNSSLSDAKAKMNTVTAEVFDRLAGNRELDQNERFEVSHGNSTFTRIDTFLDALRKDGHQVKVSIRHRVANFAGLMTKLPNGDIADVPAALMVKTGVKDAQGKEAVVPAVHSEVIIEIESSDASKHEKIDAELKWYQGISATGFFAMGIGHEPEWCGDKTSDTYTGDDAQRAIELAGVFGDVVNQVTDGLVASGYGVTGVCNDSVSVIQQAMSGRAVAYPLLMRDETVSPHLEGLLKDQSTRGDPLVRDLLKSIADLPSDVGANASQKERAEASLPYAPGEEAFTSTVHARETLLK